MPSSPPCARRGLGNFTVVGTEIVGPVVGEQLKRQGLMATVLALGGILAYIALRFQFSFAVGAIAATLHDLLVCLAFLSFFKYDLTLNVIAGLLTITGYSVNDTIVIFDRVRENMRGMRRDNLTHIVNVAVNQTLARTVITAGTTLLSVIALYLFGGEVLQRLRLHDARRDHQRHVFDRVHRVLDRHHVPGAQAREGAGGAGRRRSRRASPAAGAPRSSGRAPVTLPAAVLLGIIQGLTEFLPVSSSAHLILARFFFGWETPPELGLAFDVALHIGTLAAILAYFHADLTAMARSLPALFSPAPDDMSRLMQPHRRRDHSGRRSSASCSATSSSTTCARPAVAAGALVVGALAMMVAERVGTRERTEAGLSWTGALLIGCAQAAALVPGMSRSGSTIAVGMFLGMRRDAAARFTFLLAIPATLAAAGKESLELRHLGLTGDTVTLFVVGVLVSGVVGYLTIKYFLRFLAGHRLDVFAYYRLILAAVTVVWLWRA